MVPRAGAATAQPASDGPRAEDGETADRWARTGRVNPPTPVAPDPYDPMNPAFDPVLTLRRLGYPLAAQGGVVQAQWWMPLLESPLSKQPEEVLPRFMERIPRQSGKEAADNVPSWARGMSRRLGETPDRYARRIMDDQWGKGQWEGDPERMKDFRQIKKFGSRAFRDPKLSPPMLLPDGNEVI